MVKFRVVLLDYRGKEIGEKGFANEADARNYFSGSFEEDLSVDLYEVKGTKEILIDSK